MASAILGAINSKRGFYTKKVKSFEEWTINKSEINGATRKDIRAMLKQIFKEMLGTETWATKMIEKIYNVDFEAHKIVNCIVDMSNKSEYPFDILNKNQKIQESSIEIVLSCFEIPSGLSLQQKAGLMILIQYVMITGRNDYNGFGTCVNYIKKIKENHTKRNEKKKEEMKKEEMKKESKKEIEPVKTLAPLAIVDSWEDL